MAEIGLRSGKVRAGFYRCGAYCIHKSRSGWGVYEGPTFLQMFRTLSDAFSWCRYPKMRTAHT